MIAVIRELVFENYRRDTDAYASELWDDGDLDAVHTRDALRTAIYASLNSPIAEPRYVMFQF